MFMFNDFNYADILKIIDSLIYDRHYGSYWEMQSLTVRELMNIVNTIVSKEREKELNEAMGAGGGETIKDAKDLTPEMIKALMAT